MYRDDVHSGIIRTIPKGTAMENHESHTANHHAAEQPRSFPAWKGAAIMVAVIVGFYVLREHWGHALGFAPYLLLLACPLMHMFMHGNHGHQHDNHNNVQGK